MYANVLFSAQPPNVMTGVCHAVPGLGLIAKQPLYESGPTLRLTCNAPLPELSVVR